MALYIVSRSGFAYVFIHPKACLRNATRQRRAGQYHGSRGVLTTAGATLLSRADGRVTGARAGAGTVGTSVASRTISSRFTTSFTILQPQAVSGSRGVLVVLCAFKSGYRGARAVD